MAKSIKLKNDIYWDSNGITHNKTSLSDIINLNVLDRVNINSFNDYSTNTVTLPNNGVYLYLNSHTYKRCLLLITTWSNELKVDTIFKSEDNAVPTITREGTNVTFKHIAQAKGYLYRIRSVVCA